MASIYDTLGSLLTLNLDPRTPQGERDGAQAAFERKCKRNDIDPVTYKKRFIQKREEEERRKRERDEAAKNRSTGSNYGNNSWNSYNANGDDFWEDFFRNFSGFGGFDNDGPWGNRKSNRSGFNEEARRRQQQQEQERRKRQEEENRRREEERKRREKERKEREARSKLFPLNTIRNVRYRIEKAKFSWAYLIECDGFVEGDWIPYRVVIFSNKFELPKGYRDMMFVYETNGKQYYRGYTYVTKLYYYANGIQIPIFDVNDEILERKGYDAGPKYDNEDISSFEWETKHYEFEVTNSQWSRQPSNEIIEDLKRDLSSILMENPKIAHETITFENIEIHDSKRKPVKVVKMEVKYKKRR